MNRFYIFAHGKHTYRLELAVSIAYGFRCKFCGFYTWISRHGFWDGWAA